MELATAVKSHCCCRHSHWGEPSETPPHLSDGGEAYLKNNYVNSTQTECFPHSSAPERDTSITLPKLRDYILVGGNMAKPRVLSGTQVSGPIADKPRNL